MATPTTIVEGFSISHAAILDGADPGAELADIYGVREGTLDVDTDSFDNTGDNTVLSTWSWINFATLSITSGYVPLSVLSTLYGATLTSSGTAESITYSLPLWNEKSQNQPSRPVLLRVPSKDSGGLPRRLDIILYKVQFDPFSFDGPAYKDGLVLNYSGRALLSSVDEKGVALTEKAVGRLLSAAAL
jgi:hypothetical protein